jgi:FlaA1/EpsC-like NDP-sugar epimerase
MKGLPMWKLRKHSVSRLGALCVAYAVVFWISHLLSFELRFDFEVPAEWSQQQKWGWLWELPLRFGFLALFGQFSGLLSYFSIPDFRRVVMATGGASLVLLLLRYLPSEATLSPRGVLLMDFVLSTGGITMVRLAFRMGRERTATAVGEHR